LLKYRPEAESKGERVNIREKTMERAIESSPLFTATRVGALELANRIVMAPMTRNRAAEGNVPTALMAEYYRQRASAGLIVTEATQVAPEGQGYPSTPGIHTSAQVDGWRQVTKAVHERGGKIALQLWHVGRISHPSFQPGGRLPVAPSAIAPEGNAHTASGPRPFVAPRALEAAEIPGIVAQYARGAELAMDAGFDGVEIHGANGYLVDQFLRDGTNRRTDGYGGSVENRVRFLLEVVTAVSTAVGAERTGIRLSPLSPYNSMSDSDPETTFLAAVNALRPLGLAFIHVIEPVRADWRSAPDGGGRLTPRLRRAFGGGVIANGGYGRDTADSVLAGGEADLVSFGTAFLANPDLPKRLRLRAALNLPNPHTFYGGDAQGYTDYPTLAGSSG
jgi:N-ethylmaleimide reductase